MNEFIIGGLYTVIILLVGLGLGYGFGVNAKNIEDNYNEENNDG